MKTAIAIDSLILRDESIFILELVLNLFPNSEIYTIEHKQGGILGTIETHPIVSSFLSHKVKEESVLKKNFWILPSAVKGIPLHPSIEKVIVISRGYIHGLNLPDHVERVLYILDWNAVPQEKLGWQKLFAPYVNDWREKALRHYHKIAVSSEALKNELELPNAEVIYPTYRTEEYPFVKDEEHNFLFTHQLLYTHGLSREEFKIIMDVMTQRGETIHVLGPDSHLEDFKKNYPDAYFAGDHCEATNALHSHQAKAIWDFSRSFFPSRAMGGLSTGRPVVVRDEPVQREFLVNGVHFVPTITPEMINMTLSEVAVNYMSVDRRSLRRLGLRWNERLFKSRMARFLNKND